MTDKQIIIDGVPVQDCLFLATNKMGDDIGTYCRDFNGSCKNIQNCYFKRWQRKEQECEELKNIINEAKNSKLDLNSFFAIEAIVGEYQLELDQLKAENEGLKEEIKKHNDDMFKNPPEKRFYCKGCTLPYISKKQSQTLTEIKQIIHFNKTNRLSGGACISIEQILQKISEVDNEN